MVKKRLGEVLQERQRISSADLEKVIEEQRKSYMLLGELLLRRGIVAKDDLISALEEVSGFHYMDSRFVAVEPAVLDLIPLSAARFYCVLPLFREGNHLVTLMAEPKNLAAIDALRFLCGVKISPRFGFRAEISEAIERCYAKVRNEPAKAQREKTSFFIEQMDTSDMQFFTASSNQQNREAISEFEADLRNERTPAVRLVSALIFAAASKEASDIHIEPQALSTMVRMRVDGILRELTQIPHDLTNSLISRIKILADMDISERRKPQDGRFLVQMGKRDLDLRVSSLPTRDGEKIVVRLLNPASAQASFTDLGLSSSNANSLKKLLAKPQGMLLVTGPTGSGKSTTLYAGLNLLRSPAVNIITVEDPIEYRIQDINQVQINSRSGLTFANCLRSILRQDPNIIMVGEIRDSETAEIALQASQTGHLVLSTLHTNDSVAAVTRLVDLNVPRFLIASSVTGILAQRLVRKLCACRIEAPVSAQQRSRFASAGIKDFPKTMFTPAGCPECENMGYKGRVGIYELLVFDEQIRNAVRSGMQEEDIRESAQASGMSLMAQDGIEKAKAGQTTLDELVRVVPFSHAPDLQCRKCSRSIAREFMFCPFCGIETGKSVENASKPRIHMPPLEVNT